MKSFVSLLAIALLGSASARVPPSRGLQKKQMEYLGPDPDPMVMGTDFPLKECQGACLKDAHCSGSLVCKVKSGANFPCNVGSNTKSYIGESFCVAPEVGDAKDQANGAVVLSVNVVSASEKQQEEEEQAENIENQPAAANDPEGATEESIVAVQENSSGTRSSAAWVAVLASTATLFVGLI